MESSGTVATICLDGADKSHLLVPILESPHCTIIPYLTQFQVISTEGTPETRKARGERLWRALTTTSSLALNSLKLMFHPPFPSSSLFQAITSTLTSFDLYTFPPLASDASISDVCAQAFELISGMHNLELLRIYIQVYGLVVPPAAPGPSDIVPVPILSLKCLRRLSLTEPSAFNALLPLLSAPGIVHFPKLQIVDLYMLSNPLIVDARVLQTFLDTVCAPTVTEFHFLILWDSIPIMDLGRFQGLRYIELDTSATYPIQNRARAIDVLERAVESIGSRSVGQPVQVKYEMQNYNPPEVSGVEWIKA
ncbi:hypothetical protein Moror_10636 [Moniliophthora roreri MCA 2997]|uniref:Uncharacterized protein n=1 Tax=Moniliophthora roreri (strain MCA 2997) TaxID=1381753 RepID=V2XFX8_MONRO|nr:hypothetical protein Moror_10636 [Moniliophthora roreri MCA 2997]